MLPDVLVREDAFGKRVFGSSRTKQEPFSMRVLRRRTVGFVVLLLSWSKAVTICVPDLADLF